MSQLNTQCHGPKHRENNDKDKNTEGAQVQNSENKDNEWRRLRMIEAGEVNGVRFPPGIIIDVNAADGEKLVESKKAEYVDVDKSDENSETEENKADEGDKVTSDASEEQTPAENSEKAETEARRSKIKKIIRKSLQRKYRRSCSEEEKMKRT